MNLTLKPATVLIEERECGVDEMLALAAANVEAGWLLAESPRKCVFEPFCGKLDSQLKNEFASLVVFGPNAEIRMEKPSGQAVGWLRLLRADPAGEEFLARRSSALLRDGSGRHLLFDEYFKPDACGFLVRHCGRLCGVEEK